MFTFLSLLYCVVLGEMLTEFAMGKQEKKEASMFGGEGVTCVVLGKC